MHWTSTTVLFAIAFGGVVGFLSGMFGIGGGFLLVPLLNALLGVPMPTAIGSTACYTLGPATTAMLARRPTAGFIELPLILSGGMFAGVLSGTYAIAHLKVLPKLNVFGRALPAVDLIVLTSYAALMMTIFVVSLTDALRRSASERTRRKGLLSSWLLPPVAEIPDLHPGRYSIVLLAGTGYAVGVLSGFLGMSGGLVLIPATVFLLGLQVHDAATVTIVTVWLVSLQATVMHGLHRHIDLLLVLSLLVSGTLGARLGTEVGMRLPGRQLKIGFSLLVFSASTIVVLRLAELWIDA
ncbi:MAG: sulfite exporter TauE/SafE family protein [Planctomycetaceae bacterium]